MKGVGTRDSEAVSIHAATASKIQLFQQQLTLRRLIAFASLVRTRAPHEIELRDVTNDLTGHWTEIRKMTT